MHIFILDLETRKIFVCLQVKPPTIAEQNLDENYKFERNFG